MKGSDLREDISHLVCHRGCCPPLINEIAYGACPHCDKIFDAHHWNEQSRSGYESRKGSSAAWSRMFSRRATSGSGSTMFCCPGCGANSELNHIMGHTPKLPAVPPQIVSATELKQLAGAMNITEAAKLLT